MESTPDFPKRPAALVLLTAAFVLPAGLNLLPYWLHNPLYGHGLWVPVLAAVLLWHRGWGEPSAPVAWPARLAWAGFFALVPLLRTVQVANPDWRLLDWMLALGAVASLLALALRLGGVTLLRRWAFPLLFLLTALPWSTSLEHAFTQRAVPATATAVAEVLWAVGVPVVDTGRTLQTAAGPVEVSEDCSGIRGVQLAVMGALFWCALLGLRGWRPLAMLAGALALALLLNLLRVVVLVVAVVKTGDAAAGGRLHDPAGTAAQVALVALLPVLAWALHKRVPQPAVRNHNAPAGWGEVRWRTALAALVWVGASEAGAELWFRAHERNVASVAHWSVRRPVPIEGARELEVSRAVREVYRYSDGRSLAWQDAHGADWSLLWMDFERGAQSACTHNVHRPEICLPSRDFQHARQFADLALTIDGTPLALRHGLYARDRQVLHLFHATVQERPAGGERTWEDWTYVGRLRVAALGLRSQRSEMIHLVCEGPLTPLAARDAAADYLRQLLVRKTTPR